MKIRVVCHRVDAAGHLGRRLSTPTSALPLVSRSLKVNKPGVRVWRRSVSGAKYDEVMGQGVLNAPPEEVIALFQSTDPDVIRRFNPPDQLSRPTAERSVIVDAFVCWQCIDS